MQKKNEEEKINKMLQTSFIKTFLCTIIFGKHSTAISVNNPMSVRKS